MLKDAAAVIRLSYLISSVRDSPFSGLEVPTIYDTR